MSLQNNKPLDSTRLAIFVQQACLKHRFIRSKDVANVVERPERLRAVHIGIAAAVAHLEDSTTQTPKTRVKVEDVGGQAAMEANDLATALERLDLDRSAPRQLSNIELVNSSASVNILDNAAVKFVHGDIDGDVYLETLKTWARDSQAKISQGGSEIPEGYPQGDLYLCPGSIDAIQGALGTVCEAVDTIVSNTRLVSTDSNEQKTSRAFVAVRPPGHHCGEDTPSGFCFVNNVAVGSAHAHLKHGINRIVILDIDLHHGNGTQSIVWQINEETFRKNMEIEASNGASSEKPGPQLYYGSIHDVLSYPCEDGKVELVQAASVSIHGPHGQHIENIHLKPFTSNEEFWEQLYASRYAKLLQKASDFLDETGGAGDDVLVFISCGFDASEHEYPSMSRHGRHVPTSFYYRFAHDARKLADRYARGRLISVLEGGYSDRALTSGAMAHVSGLAESSKTKVDEAWWDMEKLVTLEKATKKRRGGRISNAAALDAFMERTLEIFASIDSSHLASATSSRAIVPPSSRTLRDRKKNGTRESSPIPNALEGSEDKKSSRNDAPPTTLPPTCKAELREGGGANTSSAPVSRTMQTSKSEPKKLPRVILRLGPQPSASSDSLPSS